MSLMKNFKGENHGDLPKSFDNFRGPSVQQTQMDPNGAKMPEKA